MSISSSFNTKCYIIAINQLKAFKFEAEVRFDVFITGKTYTASSLVITLCSLVVINGGTSCLHPHLYHAD